MPNFEDQENAIMVCIIVFSCLLNCSFSNFSAKPFGMLGLRYARMQWVFKARHSLS